MIPVVGADLWTRILSQVADQLRLWTVFLAQDEGQDVVEYGILIATIAIVVLLAIGAFGSQIASWFNTLAGHITTT